MRGESFACWRALLPLDASEVRVNDNPWPAMTNQVEVSRDGEGARDAVFPAADSDCDDCVGFEERTITGVLITDRVTHAAFGPKGCRREDRSMVWSDMAM